MAKKKDEFEEFNDLVQRMHNNGDLKVLKDFLLALKDECKYQRYSPETASQPYLLAGANGQEQSYDNVLEFIKSALQD